MIQLGGIADDFTGATDLAKNLVRVTGTLRLHTHSTHCVALTLLAQARRCGR